MNRDELVQQMATFGASNYAPFDVVLTRGEGSLVWDVDGRRYIDFLSGYSALSQGHCHPHIVRALVDQAKRLTLNSRVFDNDRLGGMLEKIAQLSGYSKVLPMNTGAEAVETAIKAIRRWGYERKGVPDGAAEIIVAEGNFHGRTTTIVGFSDDEDHRRHFGPPTPGFRLVPFGDAAAVASAIGPHTVGVLLEPIQGEGGVRIPADGYLAAVRTACSSAGILLAWDEIQTGLGRTGKMFAHEHEAARPDLLILGKALSGGFYPVSCVCADDPVMSVFTPGSHGSTYGGNPLAAAVTIAALEVIENERLVERSARLGAHALARLKKGLGGSAVREVRGRGLMMGVEYERPIAPEVSKALALAGILAKDTRGTVVRLSPPLVITEELLDEALDRAIPVLNRD